MPHGVQAHTGVSFIIPVLNEVAYIEAAIRTVLQQDYPGSTELVLALGPSTDGTTELVQRLAAADDRIVVLFNPATDIPVGLNLAIKASTHPVIVRVDAHSELDPSYTRRALATLARTGAANVGGVMRAKGKAPFQSAVARAYNSRFGLGGGSYHGGGEEGPAESAYLGVLRREVLEQVQFFDESVRRGEDWELNLRIRNAGHLVWFDPELAVTYWPRESWPKLVRQFVATGIWRGELVRRYPARNPWRFFVPPVLVASVALSLLVLALQLIGLLPGWPGMLMSMIFLGPISYLLALLGICFSRAGGTSWSDRWRFFLVLPTMHLSWGVGFILGLVRGARGTVDTSRTGI